MSMKEMVWRVVQHRYGPQEKHCFVGSICVGRVCYNSAKSQKDIGVDYRWYCLLPGLKSNNGAIATEDDAMHTVQTAVQSWFAKVTA